MDRARSLIVADRGVSHASEQVRLVASWRSGVDPRGVVVVFPASSSMPPELAEVANRFLDAGLNHALVEPSPRPLALRVDVAAMIANDKGLGHRQRIEQGAARQAVMTVFMLDDRDVAEALAVLRARPPFGVQAAIVLTGSGAPRRHVIANDTAVPLRVLELPTPDEEHLDEAAWAEILRFLDEVERDLPGQHQE
ncbi:hypothetical protein [Nannocystis punicea]|uniref:Uncharacterized protein n=1 Tax=Nannocystis punicea TaxID=2995304 RepID=A0ABY7GWR6_9BACT|nr:hypothetical protein [Nannocystis poenicansa]WAS91325.1 hypothetical protein O0S08_34490 [Nannocystis poenicansa]